MCASLLAGPVGYSGRVCVVSQGNRCKRFTGRYTGVRLHYICRPNCRAESRVSLWRPKYPAPDKTPDIGNQKTYSNTLVCLVEIRSSSLKTTYEDSARSAVHTQSIPVTTSHVPSGVNMQKNAWTKTASHWKQMNRYKTTSYKALNATKHYRNI